jgi:ribonuclease HI
MSARKLRHYFEAHTIRVLTNQSLHNIFGNRYSSGRINKWATKLSEYIVDFEKCSAIKSQILVDFIAECTEPQSQTDTTQESPWLVYCDGAWGHVGAGVAAILVSPSGIKLRFAARLQFTNEADKCTNNITKYEALLLGLHNLRAINIQTCVILMDSKVVSEQIEKECIALVHRMEHHFKRFTVQYIEWSKNTEVDDLAKVAARNTSMPADVFFQVLEDASVKIVLPEHRLININEEKDSRDPIMAYLHHYYEPDGTNKQIRM